MNLGVGVKMHCHESNGYHVYQQYFEFSSSFFPFSLSFHFPIKPITRLTDTQSTNQPIQQQETFKYELAQDKDGIAWLGYH